MKKSRKIVRREINIMNRAMLRGEKNPNETVNENPNERCKGG